MNTFWLKIAGLAAVVVGLIVVVGKFTGPKEAGKPEPKTVQDMWKQDEKRLRAEPQVQQPTKRRRRPKTIEPSSPQFKELSLEDKVRAEQLFEMALFERKKGRLPVPGMGFKKMVDYCRQIIQMYPDSIYAFKARRMLADIPRRYRKQYNITEEELKIKNQPQDK